MSFDDFREKQFISDVSVKVLVLSSAIITIVMVGAIMYKDYQAGKDIRELQQALAIILVVEALVYLLIFRSPLNTRVGKEGIFVSYNPFLLKGKVFPWNEVQSWQVRQVNAMREFGGWGYKMTLKRRKTGLIMGSGKGLEVVLTGGKTWVITTTNPEMLEISMRKYAADKEVKA